MARYIDADELYKATQKRIAEANEARMAVVDDEFLDLINDAFTEDVAPIAEWISVEERLPLNFESVLVLATSRREDDGYDVLIAYHDRGEWEERSVHGDGGTVYAHVKYWMPLPEPPKGE